MQTKDFRRLPTKNRVTTMKRKEFRLPDKVAEEFEKLAKELGISENDLGNKAFVKFIGDPKTGVEGPRMMRCPIDTHCSEEGCKKEIRFGAWCYYHPHEGTLCPECGVKRGWTGKDRIRRVIEYYELKYDLQEIKREIKEDMEQLADIKTRVNIYELGQRNKDLEEIQKEMGKLALDFMRKAYATPEEKELVKRILKQDEDIEQLKKQIKEEVAARFKFFQKKKKRKKEAITGVV